MAPVAATPACHRALIRRSSAPARSSRSSSRCRRSVLHGDGSRAARWRASPQASWSLRWPCGARIRGCRSMTTCCRVRAACAIPEFVSFEFIAAPAAGAPGVAGRHRAAAGAAPQAPRRLRTQDARAHRVGPAARSHGGRDAAASRCCCSRFSAWPCRAARWCGCCCSRHSAAGCCGGGARRGMNEPKRRCSCSCCWCPGLIRAQRVRLRGLLDIRDALRYAELTRLSAPEHWQVTRALARGVCGLPVYFAASPLGAAAPGSPRAATAALGFCGGATSSSTPRGAARNAEAARRPGAAPRPHRAGHGGRQ